MGSSDAVKNCMSKYQICILCNMISGKDGVNLYGAVPICSLMANFIAYK